MNWLDYTIDERKVMLRQTARSEHLPDYAVEKDWWVTMALKALFRTECGNMMIFKGGTSLRVYPTRNVKRRGRRSAPDSSLQAKERSELRD